MVSPIKTALIDIDRATEFVGDDVDQYSKLVDLGGIFSRVLVYVPTLTSSTVGLCIQRDGDEDTVPDPLNILDDDATGHFLSATTAGTDGMAIVFDVGAAQYLRIKCGANQTADRTFYVIGC